MKFLTVLLIACVLALSVRSDVEVEEGVYVLEEGTFDSFLQERDVSLVMFYAPWCGHCKRLKPEYNSAAQELDGEVTLAKVDCTTQREVCNRYDVTGFPTLKIFNNGELSSDYQGGRTKDDLVKYMRVASKPVPSVLSAASEFATLREGSAFAVVGHFASTEDAGYAVFKSVAEKLRFDFDFGVVFDADVAAELNVELGSVAGFREGEDVAVVYTGSTEAEFNSWLNTESFPALGEISVNNYQRYAQRGLPFLWLFVDFQDEAGKAAILEEARPVAVETAGQVSFVYLDSNQFGDYAKRLGVDGKVGLVVQSADAEGSKFVLQGDVTEDNVRQFVSDFQNGALKPFLRSEEAPQSNDGPVTVVVGSTFDDLVLNNNQDVFVKFYAPWCGHCKALAPKYEEVGAYFAENPNMVVAEVNVDANDVPEAIRGYPTLIFYPANNKKASVKYEGAREAQDMIAWLEEHATAEATGHDEL